jgi:polyphosphate glucokinase
MAKSTVTNPESILAVDIGATSIKYCLIDANGNLASEVQRLPTPYPCSPQRLVSVVTEQIRESGCARAGVGFPGELHDGLVVEPGNLSRSGGFTTEIDQSIHEEWLNLDLQGALRDASAQDVRVVNDATLAALGCSRGVGTELVFTFGTGLGIALVVNGAVVRIRDVGAEVFEEDQTYDQLLGEYSRGLDEPRWNELVSRTVNRFVAEFAADVVHLGGGNSRRIDLAAFASSPFEVVVNDNNVSLRGARRLFRE